MYMYFPAETCIDPGNASLSLLAQYYKLQWQVQEVCNLSAFVAARDIPINIAIGMYKLCCVVTI